MADPVIEHATYTWDPVSASWIHEKGPEISPPPRPPDVHALQSYFFDADSKEWIRTVLAPMGRELAAKWQGAHRIPMEPAEAPKAKAKAGAAATKGPSPVLLIVAVVVVAMVGGAGIVGAQNGLFGSVPTSLDGLASFVPQAAPSAPVQAAPIASPSASAAPSQAPAATVAPVVAPTRAPVAPPATLPAGPNAKLADGTTAVYTGPTLVVKPAALAATFTFVAPDGRPASGDATVVLGTVSVPAQMDANGRVAVSVPTTALAAGQYPIQVIHKGALTPVAFITIR
ncbi:MAG TPA: hypothetical protein VFC31_14405 [Candidatus Limnocylindria bacterium]|nr:hypothetical protein [Candidatus Limnocylindria bacterium]